MVYIVQKRMNSVNENKKRDKDQEKGYEVGENKVNDSKYDKGKGN